MTVLWLAERDGGGVAAASLTALGFARSLGEPVTAVLFGDGPGSAGLTGDGLESGGLAAGGVASVCRVQGAQLAGYAAAGWARSLLQLAAARGAVAVVAAATDRGAEVLAHLGAIAALPVAANCVSAVPTGSGQWRLVRQRWAGSVLEDAVLDAPVALFTVATDVSGAGAAGAGAAGAGAAGAGAAGAGAAGAGAAGAPRQARAPGQAGPEPDVSVFTPELEESDLLVRAAESAENGSGASLATARVVVGGGRGVGGPEGFAALEELAGLLGGVVGVSRVVTSAGWRPHRQQVGQTGTKISPELYLACGISGAIQHMAGCQGARHIVAVNTDPSAPIMSRAEFAVIGDLHEIVTALVDALRARSAPE